MTASDARALVHIYELVFADDDDIAVVQVLTAHALGFHVNAVRAVQIFDDAGLRADDKLTVMPAHKTAVDLQVVIVRAAHNHASDAQRQLAYRAALRRYQHASEDRPRALKGAVRHHRAERGCSVDAGRRPGLDLAAHA